MPDRPIRTSSSSARRMMGLLVAAGLTLIFGGVFMFMAAQRGQDTRNTPSGGALPKDIVDIGEAPLPANSNSDPNLIQVRKNGRVQSADKDDPTRLAYELAFERLDPVGPGYYTLTQPRAWVYLRDGRTLHVRADSGRVKMPAKTSQPESGEFRGHVVLRVFPPGTTPKTAVAAAIDPEKDEPAIVGITDSISFDMVLLELTTQDHIIVAARNLLFEGEGLRVVADQVKERIVQLRTKGQYLRVNPDVKDPRHAAKSAAPAVASTAPTSSLPAANTPTSLADSSPPAASPLAAAPSAKPGKEQLYKAIIVNDVTVTQTTRKLTSDSLEIFARLINNQLPDNAFGIWETATDDKTEAKPAPAKSTLAVAASAAPGNPAADRIPAPPANEATALFIRGNEDIIMSWTGPLTVTPIADGTVPQELDGGNHFNARFLAERGAGHVVTMEDTAAGAKGEVAQVNYAATTRMLSFMSGPSAPDVKFMASGVGRILVKGAQVDLGTGIAKADGGGQLLVLHATKNPTLDAPPVDKNAPIPADQIRQITWNDQADFKFRTIAGRIQSALDFAKFDGAVVARDRTSSLAADSVRVELAPGAASGKQQSTLRHLHAEGHVVAIAGPPRLDPTRERPFVDPYVIADKLDVGFKPSKDQPDEVDPTRAVAVGSVKGATHDASIKGQYLEISMARDDKHAIVPTDFVGRGDVEIERADGVTAKADSIRANPMLRTADLSGNVVLAKGPSVVHCRQAEMDDTTGILRILSPGTFDHEQARQTPLGDGSGDSAAAAGQPDPTHITATWASSMIFNNTAGTLDASGDTKVTSTSSLLTQTLLADRLQLWLTPQPSANQPKLVPVGGGAPVASSTSPSELSLGNDRQLLKAKAIGASEQREGAPHATIEIRKYAANPAAASTTGAPILAGTRPNAPAVLPPDANDNTKSPERLLEQVFYVEGPTIIADEQAGTITVPSAGRAIIRDQRAANNQALIANSSGVPVATSNSGAKGTSRFTWSDSMQFVRSTGMLTMKKDVELIHLPLGSSQVTRLVAMRMDARFNAQGKGAQNVGVAPGSAQRSAELIEAIATGAVYAKSGPQELLCDRFFYDALRGTAEASALADNQVTVHDDRQPTPLVAKRFFWDIVKERIEVMKPAPATSPR